MRKTYDFLSDANNGWLKVPMKDLIAVGLTLEEVSRCSHYNDSQTWVYLEEDFDAREFSSAYEKTHGERPKINLRKQTKGESRVKYLPYNCFGF